MIEKDLCKGCRNNAIDTPELKYCSQDYPGCPKYPPVEEFKKLVDNCKNPTERALLLLNYLSFVTGKMEDSKK